MPRLRRHVLVPAGVEQRARRQRPQSTLAGLCAGAPGQRITEPKAMGSANEGTVGCPFTKKRGAQGEKAGLSCRRYGSALASRKVISLRVQHFTAFGGHVKMLCGSAGEQDMHSLFRRLLIILHLHSFGTQPCKYMHFCPALVVSFARRTRQTRGFFRFRKATWLHSI